MAGKKRKRDDPGGQAEGYDFHDARGLVSLEYIKVSFSE